MKHLLPHPTQSIDVSALSTHINVLRKTAAEEVEKCTTGTASFRDSSEIKHDVQFLSHNQDGVHAAVIFRIVCDLCVFSCQMEILRISKDVLDEQTPNYFARLRDQSKFADIDFYYCTFGQNTKLRVQSRGWILFDSKNVQLQQWQVVRTKHIVRRKHKSPKFRPEKSYATQGV